MTHIESGCFPFLSSNRLPGVSVSAERASSCNDRLRSVVKQHPPKNPVAFCHFCHRAKPAHWDAEELLIPAAIVCAPWSRAAFLLVHAKSMFAEVDGVDLEIPPIQSSVGVVVIDFALSLRIFGPLNRKRDAAIGTEFPASVFLPCRQWMAVLIRPGMFSVLRADFSLRLPPATAGALRLDSASSLCSGW
jgi:hypothetical protein